ncbi:hypothetical protein C8Q80DRAFT_8258 [Daedaleopsis nitida]|nr:hypothetical protein C8Q80DRAFT_8258 [Daedaleopsis nitida]
MPHPDSVPEPSASARGRTDQRPDMAACGHPVGGRCVSLAGPLSRHAGAGHGRQLGAWDAACHSGRWCTLSTASAARCRWMCIVDVRTGAGCPSASTSTVHADARDCAVFACHLFMLQLTAHSAGEVMAYGPRGHGLTRARATPPVARPPPPSDGARDKPTWPRRRDAYAQVGSAVSRTYSPTRTRRTRAGAAMADLAPDARRSTLSPYAHA